MPIDREPPNRPSTPADPESPFSRRFSRGHREASYFRYGEEDANAYFLRLSELYPSPAQQAYINGLRAAMIPGWGGSIAGNFFEIDNPPPHSVAPIFPRELNENLLGVPQIKSEDIFVTMDPDKAAEVISAMNLAAYYIRRQWDEYLTSQGREIRAVLRTQTSPGNPQTLKERIAHIKRRLKFGVEFMLLKPVEREQQIEDSVEGFYGGKLRGLQKRSAADAFSDIAKALSGPFAPITMIRLYDEAAESAEFMKIARHVPEQITTAVLDEMETADEDYEKEEQNNSD